MVKVVSTRGNRKAKSGGMGRVFPLLNASVKYVLLNAHVKGTNTHICGNAQVQLRGFTLMHIRGNSIVTDRTRPDRTGPDRHTLNPFYLMKTGLRRSLINSYVERYTTYFV